MSNHPGNSWLYQVAVKCSIVKSELNLATGKQAGISLLSTEVFVANESSY